MVDTYFIATVIFSFLMAFSIGANDASNGLGTSYGSSALKLKYLLILGAVAEFIGASFCSDKSSATLTKAIIPYIDNVDYEV